MDVWSNPTCPLLSSDLTPNKSWTSNFLASSFYANLIFWRGFFISQISSFLPTAQTQSCETCNEEQGWSWHPFFAPCYSHSLVHWKLLLTLNQFHGALWWQKFAQRQFGWILFSDFKEHCACTCSSDRIIDKVGVGLTKSAAGAMAVNSEPMMCHETLDFKSDL